MIMASSIKRAEPRAIKFTPNINPYAAGSVIAEFGNTKVHITANVEESVPRFLKDENPPRGWVTAEYAMLPGSTHDRVKRERKGLSGRSQEIQRLIGRSLRSVVDMEALGQRTITVDCDVLVADGGTRTTSISGAYVALSLAVRDLLNKKLITKNPLKESLAAISVGINADGEALCDLNYEEDSSCHTDMNVVMTDSGRFVEIQGTAEGEPFTPEQLQSLLACAKTGIDEVIKVQNEVLK